jgi:hypothetical protein
MLNARNAERRPPAPFIARGDLPTTRKNTIDVYPRRDENAHALSHNLHGAISRCSSSTSNRKENSHVRKRRNRESKANSKEPKRNYRQPDANQVQPGSHKEESSHNSKKSGQPQYHPQKSKTNTNFAEKVVLQIAHPLVLLNPTVARRPEFQ